MKATFIYITAGNLDEAKKIGRELISRRLAACVNIIDDMVSMFWWKDEIQEEITPEQIISFCKSRMAAYKYPRQVEFVDEIPKTPTGKFLRRSLRDKGEQ